MNSQEQQKPKAEIDPSLLSIYTEEERFRDTIGTLTADGKRKWIHPKKTSGWYTQRRTILAVVLLVILFAGPFISINGRPLLLLNVVDRRFVIFGQPFWPQDFFLFVIALLSGVLSVALFTVAFGRLFCGWVCPQTIFMEFVFRKIEYWIEGDAYKQQALAKKPWNDSERLWKGVLKHSVFYAISFAISNIFLAYIIGKDAWIALITDPPSQHIAGLSIMLAFSGVFYLVFARLREQICIIACPYGRLQGVLLDKSSMVVAYDYVRGEKRGKMRKGEDRAATGMGHCIDCSLCVQVCPTGIDIRNGTQLECIGCTACIDACNTIMDKVNQPRGLVRYASTKTIEEGVGFRFTPRMAFYMVVLVLLLGLFVGLLVTRSDVEATILRTPGMTYSTNAEGKFVNIYNYDLVNKTFDQKRLSLKLLSGKGALSLNTREQVLTLQGQQELKGQLIMVMDKADLDGTKTEIEIGVFQGDTLVDKVETSFLGPFVAKAHK